MRTFVLVTVLVLIPMSSADAQIPQVERDALVALYNSTDGANWSNNTNWLGEVGTECTWYGVDCAGDHVRMLGLSGNQLNGSIPLELGSLSGLEWLSLPFNQLSGVIPGELGSLSLLQYLELYSNQLSAAIPAELGNLSSLLTLDLNSNQLSGSIPPELRNLTSLTVGYGLDLRWNALHSDDPALIVFLNSKQVFGDWQSTQTIAPDNVAANSVGDHTVWLIWDAVSYQSDPGGYEVFSAPAGSGVWISGGWTDSKTDVTFPVTALDPASDYDFSVVTYTDPHSRNLNLVTSDFSPPVMATTADFGCAQPIIVIAWGEPITLSVLGSWDSFLWSTGETTPSIAIDSPSDEWYWVSVTSSGLCEETGAILAPGTVVFADGFESGNTSAWSSKVP